MGLAALMGGAMDFVASSGGFYIFDQFKTSKLPCDLVAGICDCVFNLQNTNEEKRVEPRW